MGPLARALVKFLYQCDQKALASKRGGGPHDEATMRILGAGPSVICRYGVVWCGVLHYAAVCCSVLRATRRGDYVHSRRGA